ncbi:MAG: S-adenosylmethionine synthetase [Lachnospiraceae bacterium]|nr:S-adenosylmethionine synthetase [Lachnospiraceae bacterium]
MFEKVNPSHPDKLADRIGGAIVDLGYKLQKNPKIAGECLIGHGVCHIIIETSVDYNEKDIKEIVDRIADSKVELDLKVVPQDIYLATNQNDEIKCGDNGIFKACKVSDEEIKLTKIVEKLYVENPTDGKFIYDENTDTFIACQSNIKTEKLKEELLKTGIKNIIVNPLGDWTGGINVDTGATNRKLGSDMGRAVTGGGLHFKDISKSDVSVNVYLHKIANEEGLSEVTCKCAIGDKNLIINGKEVSYKQITDEAFDYIKNKIGGFEKLAEWGLIR